MDEGQITSYIVAVAAADPGLDHTRDVATLAPPWCDRLQAFFQDGARGCNYRLPCGLQHVACSCSDVCRAR
jgi:hypothetical protein